MNRLLVIRLEEIESLVYQLNEPIAFNEYTVDALRNVLGRLSPSERAESEIARKGMKVLNRYPT